MDRMIKMIEATKDHDVLIWENKEGTKGYLSIRHKSQISETFNEVFVKFADLPDLVKSLISVTLQQTRKVSFREGLFEAWNMQSEEFSGHLKHYLATGGTIESLLSTAKQIQQGQN